MARSLMKRLVIYDLDGTLVDTADDITQSVNHVLGELGGHPMRRADVIPFIGRGLRELIASCVQTEDPRVIERGMASYRAYYTKHLLDSTALYPAAQRVLEHFKDRRQAVVSNKPNPFTQDILTGLGVADYFIEVIAGDSGYPRKPDPTGIRAIMEKTGHGAHETLLVGDSPIDVEAGRNAEVLTVAVEHGFGDAAELRSAHPDVTVANLEEFLELASQRGW